MTQRETRKVNERLLFGVGTSLVDEVDKRVMSFIEYQSKSNVTGGQGGRIKIYF